MLGASFQCTDNTNLFWTHTINPSLKECCCMSQKLYAACWNQFVVQDNYLILSLASLTSFTFLFLTSTYNCFWHFQTTILNRLHHTSYRQCQLFGQPEAVSAQGTEGAEKPMNSAPSMIWSCYNKVTWWTSNLAASVALWKQVAAWSCNFLSTSSLAGALCARPRTLVSGQQRSVSPYCKDQMQSPQ